MATRKILISSIAAAILSSSVYGDETTQMDSVDVWDTEVVSSSLDMSGTAIETKQADHLSDLLRDLPGVDVGGTHSINNRLNIRGLEDENLEISIDGAKVQSVNMFHHIGNLLINPDILKRVEIEVGANSVVHGGLGGAVNFETKDGEDLLDKGQEFGGRVQATYNSNDSISGSVAAYGKVGENGDIIIYHNQVSKGNWDNGAGEEKFGVEGDVSDTLVKYGHKLSDTQKIIISYDKVDDEGDYAARPDFGNEYNIDVEGGVTFPTEYTRETITLKHELRLDDTTVDTSLYTNENELTRYETWSSARTRGATEGLLEGLVKTSGLNVKAQTNLMTGNILNTFTYGGIYDKQSSEVDFAGADYGTDEEAVSKAIYVEDAIDFDNGLVLTPGIRYNKYDYDGAYGVISDTEPTYSLAAEYSATDSLTLLASATTLFKGVEMVDVLASNRVNVAVNNDLKSETGLNKEVGFKYVKDGLLGADSAGVLFKYFNTTINDYINQTYLAMTNMGDYELDGFEASFSYNKGDLSTLLSYTRSETEFKETGYADKRDPGDTVSLSVDYNILSNLALSWQSQFVMKEEDVAEPLSSANYYVEKEAYDVHNIAINYKPVAVKNLTLIAGIDNIFDEEYISHISENRLVKGYSTGDIEPGRNVKVSVAYKF
eukprot:Anaeramoba_flamelloidesa567276_39.p1 GENE.a567276_39~~a567276_39.p1  ORF type:complete len:659 (+),score=52.97 a567276_39:37-2013(+)